LNLEVNSAGANGLVVDHLVALSPRTRFVLMVREPRSWLDSLVNHSLSGTAPPHWERLRRLLFDTGRAHPPGESVLAERQLFTLDGYLGEWARRHTRILEVVPPDRLLVLRTEQLADRLGEVARIAGVDAHTLSPDRAHEFGARERFGLLDQIDQAHLEDRIDAVCAPVMGRLEALSA
jgi:hypothetical protein